MSDYQRSTRECTINELALISNIRAHIEKYQLGEVEKAVVLCCETTSTKQKKGMFGGKGEVIVTSIILTAQWLIWATRKNDEAVGVLSAKLRDIQVQDYEKSDMQKLMPDSGVNISGLRTDATEVGSTFIGLGVEPAAQKFRNSLRAALTKI